MTKFLQIRKDYVAMLCFKHQSLFKWYLTLYFINKFESVSVCHAHMCMIWAWQV